MSLSAMRTPWLRPACWASLLCVRMIPRHLFRHKLNNFFKIQVFKIFKIQDTQQHFDTNKTDFFYLLVGIVFWLNEYWLLLMFIHIYAKKVSLNLLASPVVAMFILPGPKNSLEVSLKSRSKCDPIKAARSLPLRSMSGVAQLSLKSNPTGSP